MVKVSRLGVGFRMVDLNTDDLPYRWCDRAEVIAIVVADCDDGVSRVWTVRPQRVYGTTTWSQLVGVYRLDAPAGDPLYLPPGRHPGILRMVRAIQGRMAGRPTGPLALPALWYASKTRPEPAVTAPAVRQAAMASRGLPEAAYRQLPVARQIADAVAVWESLLRHPDHPEGDGEHWLAPASVGHGLAGALPVLDMATVRGAELRFKPVQTVLRPRDCRVAICDALRLPHGPEAWAVAEGSIAAASDPDTAVAKLVARAREAVGPGHRAYSDDAILRHLETGDWLVPDVDDDMVAEAFGDMLPPGVAAMTTPEDLRLAISQPTARLYASHACRIQVIPVEAGTTVLTAEEGELPTELGIK